MGVASPRVVQVTIGLFLACVIAFLLIVAVWAHYSRSRVATALVRWAYTASPAFVGSVRTHAALRLARRGRGHVMLRLLHLRLLSAAANVAVRGILLMLAGCIVVVADAEIDRGPAFNFGSILLPVDATVVAVGVAALVFALQVYAGRAPGTSLVLLARDTHLLWFFHFGMVILIALSLEVAAGLPVAGSAIGSFVIFAWLPGIFVKTVNALSPSHHMRRLLESHEATLEVAVLEAELESEANAVLLQACERLRVDIDMHAALAAPRAFAEARIVTDFRLPILEELAARSDRLVLNVIVGSTLRDDPLVSGDGASERTIAKLITVERR